ncbi:PqqD family protein [Streptococcus suis]|nr:PqqD family protein [Streptococcus suis]NQJ77084.1 PqqD family protein [Streptococcus suis]
MYTFSNNISWQKINDYIYIVNESTGQIYYLDYISKYIWEAIDNSIEISSVIQELSDTYNLNNEQLNKDVFSFLRELQKEGLLL